VSAFHWLWEYSNDVALEVTFIQAFLLQMIEFGRFLYDSPVSVVDRFEISIGLLPLRHRRPGLLAVSMSSYIATVEISTTDLACLRDLILDHLSPHLIKLIS
jgi:hypothetical protein